MVRLTEDTIGDVNTPDLRNDKRVLETGHRVLREIGDISSTARRAMRSNFLTPSLHDSGRISRTARAFKYEARNQVHDIPRNDRTGLEMKEGYFRAERMAIPDHKLAETRGDIEMLPKQLLVIKDVKAKDRAGNNIDVDIEIDHQKWFWEEEKSSPELQRLLRSKSRYSYGMGYTGIVPAGYFTHDLFVSMLKGVSPAIVTRRGITVKGPGFHHFTKEQTEEIAQAYDAQMTPYRDIVKMYSASGTSELNIQTALKFAQEDPEGVLEAMTVDKQKATNEYHEARSKLQLLQNVTDLGALSKMDTISSFTDSMAQLRMVRADINHIARFDTRTPTDLSRRGQELLAEGLTYATHPAEILRELRAEERTMTQLGTRYLQIGSALERIYASAEAAGKLIPAITQYITVAGAGAVRTADPNKLIAGIDPKIIADELTRALELDSREDIQKEVAEKDAARKADATPLSSRERILRTYQMHFMKLGEAEDTARDEAEKLYGLNAVGHTEWKVAKETLQREDVLGQQGLVRYWPYQQLKELALGSQESFVCHIAESPAIGLQHEITNRFYNPIPGAPKFTRLFDSTRRLGFLWRKTNARPSWGAMDYHQLLTSFYAIRNSVRAGYLSNTRYIRAMTDEITRLLLDKFSVDLARDFDVADMTPDERNAAESAHQQELLHDQIRLLLAGDPPADFPELASSVNEAIAHARRETGGIRRWAGRELLNATGWGKKTYTSIPARTAAAVVKSPYTVGKWAIGKIGSGIQSLWKASGAKTKFF